MFFFSPLIRSKSLSKSNYEAFRPGPDAGPVNFSVGEQGGVVALIFVAQPLWLPPHHHPIQNGDSLCLLRIAD